MTTLARAISGTAQVNTASDPSIATSGGETGLIPISTAGGSMFCSTTTDVLIEHPLLPVAVTV